MGFKSNASWVNQMDGRNGSSAGEKNARLLSQLIPDDLLEYGFIPEMVGRLPGTAALEPLDQGSLMRVLTEPKNAIIKQYQQLFSIDNVELVFAPKALEMAAAEALKRNTGARGLRSIIEDTLMDVMYELPSLKGVERCIVDSEAILGQGPPILLTGSGQRVEPPVEFRRLA